MIRVESSKTNESCLDIVFSFFQKGGGTAKRYRYPVERIVTRTENSSKRILVACIGNIFLGDDGFGVEVSPTDAETEKQAVCREC